MMVDISPKKENSSKPQGQEGLPESPMDPWGLFDHLPVPAAAYDLSDGGRIKFINSSFVEIFGYTLDDIPTLGAWAERAYPDPVYRAQVLAQWSSEIAAREEAGKISVPSEYTLVDKTGQTHSVLIGFALYRNIVLATFNDVTEIRAVEATLATERQKLECTALALTENMPGGAYTMVLRPGETMAEFSFLSQRFLDMLDLDREQTVGDPTTGFSCVHPDDRAQWLEMNAKAFAQNAPFSGEARVVVRGETRWIRAESTPRSRADGTIVWEGILVDITQLKETEQQLRSVLSAARAYTYRGHIPDRKLEYDAKWAELVGHPPGEPTMPSEEWFRTLHPDDVPYIRAKVDALIHDRMERDVFTYRRKLHGEEWIWVQVHVGISERDQDGKPVALSGVNFDITEEMTRRLHEQEKQADLREDLQRAQQRDTIAHVAGGVAHDLNNLIGLVMWTLETLETASDDQAEVGSGLVRIRRAVDMARDLVVQLGGMVRPSAPRARHDLREFLTQAAHLLRTQSRTSDGIRVHLPETAVPIWANPTELLQVIVNIATNACNSGTPDRTATVEIEAMPSGTRAPERDPDVGVPIPHGDDVSIFTVSDTGRGIPQDVLPQLFKRNLKTKGENNTGLGLSIVAAILQDNNAALWIDTELEQGTRVTVAWPTNAIDMKTGHNVSPRANQVPGKHMSPLNLEGVKALVVDDLADVAQVLAEMLESAGALAFSETDTEFVQEVLSDAPEDWSVLVTDLHMPGIDGHALARFAGNLTPPVPVILVTARPDTLGDFSLQDFATVLAKPVSANQLVEAVHAVIKTRKEVKPNHEDL